MTAHMTDMATDPRRAAEDRGTPEQVLASIVDGINREIAPPFSRFGTEPLPA
jgi:hypothetical protein